MAEGGCGAVVEPAESVTTIGGEQPAHRCPRADVPDNRCPARGSAQSTRGVVPGSDINPRDGVGVVVRYAMAGLKTRPWVGLDGAAGSTSP